MDPEIEAMSVVANALLSLDPGAQTRVLRWASDRYQISDAPPERGLLSDDGGAGAKPAETPVVLTPVFGHFAELFAQARPTSNDDKALVAAYWIQVIEGNDQWASAALNAELKNLGHAIANIASALTVAINKRPQRVIQLKKSGSSVQARKTYKVTHEGLVYVEAMLAAGAR